MSMLTVAGDTIIGLAGQCDTPSGVEVGAFDRHSGQRRWTTPLDGAVTTRNSRVIVSDNVAVFGTGQAGVAMLYGIDVRDGTQRWRRDTFRADLGVTVPVIIGQDAADDYVALDPVTGTERWRRQTTAARLTAVDGADVVIEEHAGPTQPDQTVTALDAATGTELWTRPAADVFAGDHDTIVFNLPNDAGVVAIDRTTGEEKWRTDGLIMLDPSNGPTVSTGRLALYRQATGETVIASLATGQTLWSLDTTVSVDATILGDVVVHEGAAHDGQPTLELLDAGTGAHLGTIHTPPLEHGQVDVPYIITDGTLYGGRGCTGQG
jgi:outer membrane protein assembly factor BamB